MQIPPSLVKILKLEFESKILSADWLSMLLGGELYEFEQLLYKSISSLYDKICETLIRWLSCTEAFLDKQRKLAKRKGLKKLVSRPVELQPANGYKNQIRLLICQSGS